MDIINIYFFADDYDYAVAVGEIISYEYNNIFFEVVNCNNIDKLKINELIKKYRSNSDNLIISDSSTLREKIDIYISKNEELDNDREIYKYLPLDEYIKKLFYILSTKFGKFNIYKGKKKTKIISVISSKGGAGKTVISLGIAQELVRFHDKKVLYISLEEIESSIKYFDIRENTRDIGEFLYYYRKYKNMIELIELYTVKDKYGIHTFVPAKSINQIRLLHVKEYIDFIESIVNTNYFDFMIIEVNQIEQDMCRWTLDISENIINIKLKKNQILDEKYEEILYEMNIYNIKNKIYNIYNFEDKNEGIKNNYVYYDNESFRKIFDDNIVKEEKKAQNSIKKILKKKNDEENKNNEENESIVEILLEKNFGYSIKNITEKILI